MFTRSRCRYWPGDNIVMVGDNMSWNQGPTLIGLLESLSVYNEPFRFSAQLVARHNGHEANYFGGYMGRIEAGKVSKCDKLVVQPSSQNATIKDILVLEGSLESAVVGQSVTLSLDEYLDISRGDMLTSVDRAPTLLKSVNADLCWLAEDPLDLHRKYLIKNSIKPVAAHVTKVDTLLDINIQERRRVESLKLNDIARVSLNVQQGFVADSYDAIRAIGAFIMIDEVTHHTVVAGIIRLD